MKIAIIYHRADYDGILSEAVCRTALNRDEPESHIASFGWNYNDPLPIGIDFTTFDRIYIVDLSVDELMSRSELRDKIVWIDHHRTAIEKWEKPEHTFDGLRIDGVAACRLCWAFFNDVEWWRSDAKAFDFRRHNEPLLVFLAGVYDVWLKGNSDFEAGKDLQFGLRAAVPLYLEKVIVDSLSDSQNADNEVLAIVETGRQIRDYCQRQNDDYSRSYSQTIRWEGLTFCALNIGQRGNSDLLLGGIKPEHDACFAWRWTGKEVLVSLYHISGHEEHDLSEIAKRYGGGGHKGACGFRLSLAQLEEILKH